MLTASWEHGVEEKEKKEQINDDRECNKKRLRELKSRTETGDIADISVYRTCQLAEHRHRVLYEKQKTVFCVLQS